MTAWDLEGILYFLLALPRAKDVDEENNVASLLFFGCNFVF